MPRRNASALSPAPPPAFWLLDRRPATLPALPKPIILPAMPMVAACMAERPARLNPSASAPAPAMVATALRVKGFSILSCLQVMMMVRIAMAGEQPTRRL